jgi:WD40 repeat protein
MSYCLNPDCHRPQNPAGTKFCQSCGARLLLADRYRAIKPIGQGGFGKTFLAVDEHKPSRRYCVIKQFFPQIQGTNNAEKAAELFRQEAVLLDQMGKHPQIPELLAAFIQDRRLYLVQDFIDGQNLAQELADKGAFNEGQIRQLLNDLLPVLQLLHDNQIIHRDIKPENIVRRSSDRRLFLVDFGISKIITDTVAERTGTRIGSPEYVAPEQAMGKATFASDIFSLGVTCIHLLTNVRRFQLYSLNEDKWIWRNYLISPISDELAKILDKMLERGTKRRYQSAVAVLNDLNPQTIQGTTKLAGSIANTSASNPQTHWQCVHTLVNGDSYWAARTVRSVAVCLDNQILASGDDDGTIKLWNLITGKEIRTLSGHSKSKWVCAVTFSPDGQMLVSGSNDKSIKLWDWKTKQQIHNFFGHTDYVNTVAISPDGQTLASGSSDKTIIVWNLITGERIKTLFGHLNSITSVTFSPDGQFIVSGSSDKTIKIWDWTTGEKSCQINDLAGVKSIAVSRNGQILVSGNHKCEIKLWDLQTLQLIQAFVGHTEGSFFLPSGVNSVTISPDGQIIASGGRRDKTVKLWDLPTGELIASLCGHSKGVTSVAFSADGKTLVSGSYDKTIKIWRHN